MGNKKRIKEDKPAKCTMLLCNHVFDNLKCLKKHMEFHAGLMPFLCTQCGMAYKTQEGVERHLEMKHDKEVTERPLKNLKGFFVCNVCAVVIPLRQKKIHIETHIPSFEVPA